MWSPRGMILIFLGFFQICSGFQYNLPTSIVATRLYAHANTQNINSINGNRNCWIDLLDPDIYGEAFLQRLRELQHFKDTNGHCLVPKRYKANPTLGNFVNKIRQQWRKYDMGEKSSLTPERILILEKIGFRWDGRFSTESPCHSIQVKRNSIWLTRFQQLKDYIDRNNGDTHKLPSHTPLGAWASRQRHEKKKYDLGEKSSLTKERIQYLDSIHFCWTPRENLWDLRLQELKEFQEQMGHCLVPTQFSMNRQLVRQDKGLRDLINFALSFFSTLFGLLYE